MPNSATLKKLKSISTTKAFNDTGLSGTKKRIEFLTLVVEAGLFSDMVNYVHFDSYGLGERTLDTCFEMYDSANVVASILTKSNLEPLFKTQLIRAIGQTTFDEWSKTHLKSQDVDAFELV